MAQMRRIEFPKIVLRATRVDDTGAPVLEPVVRGGKPAVDEVGRPVLRPVMDPIEAKRLHLMALAAVGAASYEALSLHLPITAAVENAEDGFVLLEEKQWTTLTTALETYKQWPWYHNDVKRVIDAAKDAEKVTVAEETKPKRRQQQE